MVRKKIILAKKIKYEWDISLHVAEKGGLRTNPFCQGNWKRLHQAIAENIDLSSVIRKWYRIVLVMLEFFFLT